VTCQEKITVDVKGEILELKNTIKYDGGSAEFIFFRGNAHALEVGTEGKLGGQALVKELQEPGKILQIV